jgi:hypothetical protein
LRTASAAPKLAITRVMAPCRRSRLNSRKSSSSASSAVPAIASSNATTSGQPKVKGAHGVALTAANQPTADSAM